MDHHHYISLCNPSRKHFNVLFHEAMGRGDIEAATRWWRLEAASVLFGNYTLALQTDIEELEDAHQKAR